MRFALVIVAVMVFGSVARSRAAEPAMHFGDMTRLGRPFAKDPSVVKFQGKYWLYFSISENKTGWSIGIANSTDLIHWTQVGEMLPTPGTIDAKGLCAPGARVLDGKVHLFYQSYGTWKKDAICHAVSDDGIHFGRDKNNPIFRPTGQWSVGRAIDAEVFEHDGKLMLYYATRDPQMKIQQVGIASADVHSDFGPTAWTDLSPDGPAFKPEMPWEQECIEAPTVCRHGDSLFMFYAGAYNNAPQQIGCATSKDAIHWTRVSDQPVLPNGKPGDWNSSESGHPGVFVDDDGQTYLFFQGNNDHGKTWYLSIAKVTWTDGKPTVTPIEKQ